MIVAFIGNDGGGKSSTFRCLRDQLTAEKKKVVWVPGFEHLFADKIKLLFQKISGKPIKSLQAEYGDRNAKRSFLFRLWPYVIYFDCIGLLLKYAFRGKTIIFFDRYPYDYAVSFQELGISSGLVHRLLLALPKPKHIFLFDASPEIAYERKKHDHSGDLAYYTRQRARYLELAHQKKIPVINTDHQKEQEIANKLRQQIHLL